MSQFRINRKDTFSSKQAYDMNFTKVYSQEFHSADNSYRGSDWDLFDEPV